jgi:hemerythrin-like domain-containing protein
MKRDPALISLSHEHQHGLAIALDLTRATEGTAPAIAAAFASFWENEGRRHFRAEEELLLPALARHAPADHPAVVRVLVDHVELRRRAAALPRGSSAPLKQVRKLGQRLGDHIRYEERVLFPLVERALPQAELTQLAAALQQADRAG